MSDLLKMTGLQRMLLLSGLLVGTYCLANSQHVTYKQYIRAADHAFDHKDYFNAFRFYSEALAFPENDSLILEKAAESAMHSWRLDAARILFDRVLTLTYDTCNTNRIKALYHLGLVYQRMGDNTAALNTLKKAGSCQDSSYVKRIQMLAESVKWAVVQQDTFTHKIDCQQKRNGEHFLAPVYYDEDTLLFTRLYFCRTCQEDFVHDVGQISFDSTNVLFRSDLGGEKNNSTIGYLTFNHDKSRIYYSECLSINTLDQQCQIVTQTFNNGILQDKEVVLGGSGNDSVTFTHPNYVRDPSGKEGLYFVSNRPGGRGGMDIWLGWFAKDGITIDPDSLIKMECINSAADEVSPYYDVRTHNLYFSSDRLDDGKSYGGQDIYCAADLGDRITFNNPVILPKPINSTKNDVFYVTMGDTSWFSSNRLDPYNYDQEGDACCYDLFTAIDTTPNQCKLEFCPQIINYCTSAAIPVDSVSLKLFLLVGSDSTKFEVPFDSTRKRFPVERGKDYMMTADRRGFIKGQLSFSIRKDEFQTGLRDDDCCVNCCILFLQPQFSKLKVVTEYRCSPSETMHALHGCTVLLISDRQEVICIEGKTKDTFEFNLQELRTYTLEVRHPNFPTRLLTIPVSYQRRGACEQIMKVNMNEEINLYFENDIPASAYLSDTVSSLTYSTISAGGDNLIGYASLSREQEYKSREPKYNTAIDSFFDKMRSEIIAYQSLKMWMYKKFITDTTNKVTLLIEGRASPLAEDPYKIVLSQRRINSIEKDMEQDLWLRSFFRKNIFIRKDPGPRGEIESRTLGISADKNNPGESIYNPKAAEQRRISIRILANDCNKENH